jgi:hypothetical protein
MAAVRGEWDVISLVGCPICGLRGGSATVTRAAVAAPLMVAGAVAVVTLGLVGAL